MKQNILLIALLILMSLVTAVFAGLENITLACGCEMQREPKIQNGVVLVNDKDEIQYTERMISFCEEHNPVSLEDRQAQAVRDAEDAVRAIERVKEQALKDKIMTRLYTDTIAKLEAEGKLTVNDIEVKDKLKRNK